jgi:hypothetical protein
MTWTQALVPIQYTYTSDVRINSMIKARDNVTPQYFVFFLLLEKNYVTAQDIVSV